MRSKNKDRGDNTTALCHASQRGFVVKKTTAKRKVERSFFTVAATGRLRGKQYKGKNNTTRDSHKNTEKDAKRLLKFALQSVLKFASRQNARKTVQILQAKEKKNRT